MIHLVEQPLVLEGSFDERFLSLPAAVIETAMQSHQRYFPLGGNRFAFVANGETRTSFGGGTRTSSRDGWTTRASRSSGT